MTICGKTVVKFTFYKNPVRLHDDIGTVVKVT